VKRILFTSNLNDFGIIVKSPRVYYLGKAIANANNLLKKEENIYICANLVVEWFSEDTRYSP